MLVVDIDESFLRNLYRSLAHLREAGPVHQVIGPDGEKAWLITRYASVRALLNDERLSMSRTNTTGGRQHSRLPAALAVHILNTDPPDHTRLRRLIANAFTSRKAEGMRERVQSITDGLIDAMVRDNTSADLMASLASPLPFTVICDLLGVAAEDRAQFQSWVDVLVDGQADRAAVVATLSKLHRYMVNLVEKKRSRPNGDLLSVLITARDSEDRLTEDELLATSFFLMAAGYETTINLIGNATLALLTHPALRARLREESSLTSTFIDEVLRFDPPASMSSKRFATTDIDVDGVTIPAGATVLLSLASANRDPDIFSHPDQPLIIPREAAHLSFGHGIHYCLGAPLARLEGQIAIDTIMRRLPNLALAVAAEDLRWRSSARIHGLASLPVTF